MYLHSLDLGLGENVEEEPHVQALEVDGVDDGREGACLLSVPGPEDSRILLKKKQDCEKKEC